MKCEKCNEREATFFYSSNYNGKKSESHLCAECAREAGFGEMLSPAAMFDDAFGSFFEDFFSPLGSFPRLPSFDIFGGGGRSIMAPSLPRLRFVVDGGEKAPSAPMEASEARVPDAVAAEDYEKAITLRDELRRLEK